MDIVLFLFFEEGKGEALETFYIHPSRNSFLAAFEHSKRPGLSLQGHQLLSALMRSSLSFPFLSFPFLTLPYLSLRRPQANSLRPRYRSSFP